MNLCLQHQLNTFVSYSYLSKSVVLCKGCDTELVIIEGTKIIQSMW